MQVKNAIAERVLEFRQEGRSRAQKVTVRIGAPEPIENGNWAVIYEIRGPGRRRRAQEVGGVDSVQAIYMAMANVPLDVRQLEVELGGKVTFLDSDDLRFPRLI
ncbi:DUF6968 family protein [Polyangium aurulentum]|uniref:DUF6968 family protein n=1 Tax=Polyangium aurulentum TaxID=2567896 RepID=UPI0010AE3691|nr:hypothetical protein [Polyangium aurulentum]UQA55787.1 hypothetical protein E8A73_031210 [Polyangium aurulentum]